MWRGDGRSGIAVAAPFGWRCPMSQTLAPFPHPAHRTGHADLPHPALGQDSRLRPRRAAADSGQAYEQEVPVKVREWINPALASPDLIPSPQPPAYPRSGVVVEPAIRRAARAYVDVGRPVAWHEIQLLHRFRGLRRHFVGPLLRTVRLHGREDLPTPARCTARLSGTGPRPGTGCPHG